MQAADYPAYFDALRRESCVAADDLFTNPSTQGFAADYLAQHGVTALLATPIHIRGGFAGRAAWNRSAPACHGRRRINCSPMPWPILVTLALVEFEVGQAKQQAQSATERLRAVFDASRDAMLLADAVSGIILDANRQACSVCLSASTTDRQASEHRIRPVLPRRAVTST